MKRLHVVPGLNVAGNGIAVAAKLIAEEQGSELIDCSDCSIVRLRGYDEIWVHSMWLPMTLKACWKVLRLKKENLHSTTTTSDYNSSPRLVRMTHANLDPLRYRYHGWKKRLVAPIERWLFKRTDRVVVTCEAEKKWCQEWGLRNRFEIVDLKRFFDLNGRGRCPQRPATDEKRAIAFDGRCGAPRTSRHTRILYLGRRHPLKGVEFLERAVEELVRVGSRSRTVELRIVSDHFGEELEKDWDWCDVLVLPTLSENFGLVVAEALERGKMVITTDGAPAWGEGELFDCSDCSDCSIGYGGRLIYLKGYRDGTDEERVSLLKDAILGLV